MNIAGHILETIEKNNIDNLPKTSGVYFFYSKNLIIYIGKSINIKNRVKNHFQQPTHKDNIFIKDVEKIGFIVTNNEIQALILEANLIKKFQPKFNQIWRDDKNYFYVAISKNKDDIFYIYITHQKIDKKAYYIGPFVEGVSLKKVMRLLRKVFPYYTKNSHSKLKCAYCHIDLCPGPNPDLKNYKNNIKKLIKVLEGKSSIVLKLLKKEMILYSKNKEFEKAGKTRDQIFALEKIISHKNSGGFGGLPMSQENWIRTQENLQKVLNFKKTINRIECYDISNIQGKFATGSMVVFINGKPQKSEYKKFKIKIENKPNDVAMLKEVLQRRFLHNDWKYPEIILIDGGKAQLNVAINSKPQNLDIKIISIAKGHQELFIERQKNPIPLKNLPQEIYNLIKNLDNEAHNFAINYHKKLRKQKLLEK